ncbi:Hsp70 family protein [Dactylosporangium sp. CA-233914]|uniref:Hsp70 family protein n=1 Tax=Dactylosporangium sp. CA-233914 TaxID=3239934 RepID=UPI003D91525F
MTAARLRLGVDFGTSTTIAMLQRPDARVQALLFDGSPLLSSAVLLGPDGQLHTGRDAAHLARSAPERLEPNPKRRIDDTSVLLGDAEVSVLDLMVAVLSRVAREAGRVAGPVRDVALTHPANWGANRRALLTEAARRAGFAGIELVGEPTAAATYFAHTRGGGLPVGACVLVYDLGAGTCDVTLLRRTPTGFEQVASDGLNDVGGLDVDAAIVAFLQATYGELWTSPATRRQLWDDVRSAKEMLSRASHTVIGVPALGREVPLGREQLEGLTRPVLRSTISMTRALVNESGVGTAAIAGLFLVGGSSRIPLVATMLHESLGIAPVVAEQPELVVAEGALHVNRMPTAAAATAPATAPITAPVSAVPSSGVPVSPAAYPVTGAFAAAPVSAPSVAPSPVSPPVPGLAQPPVYPQPPVMPTPFPPAPPRRGLSPLVLVAVVLAGVLVIGAGIAGALHFLGDQDPGSNPTTAGSNGGTGNRPSPGDPGKYDLAKLPENECTKTDATMYYDLFEGEITKPAAQRVPNATVNQSSCSYTRSHALTDAGKSRTASITFSASAYNDVSIASSVQKSEADTAKIAGPNTAVPGLGEEAVLYETSDNGDSAAKKLQITLAVRDSNVRVIVYFIANRNDGAAWTQKEKDDIRDKTVDAAKSALSKTLDGMRR